MHQVWCSPVWTVHSDAPGSTHQCGKASGVAEGKFSILVLNQNKWIKSSLTYHYVNQSYLKQIKQFVKKKIQWTKMCPYKDLSGYTPITSKTQTSFWLPWLWLWMHWHQSWYRFVICILFLNLGIYLAVNKHKAIHITFSQKNIIRMPSLWPTRVPLDVTRYCNSSCLCKGRPAGFSNQHCFQWQTSWVCVNKHDQFELVADYPKAPFAPILLYTEYYCIQMTYSNIQINQNII